MTQYGPRDTRSFGMLTGWDAAALQEFRLQDGTTAAQVLSQLNAAITGVSNEIYNDPIWSMLVSYTDQPQTSYRVGTSNGMQLHTEYGRPDPKRSDTTGHMLPLQAWDRALGWTWDYLRKEETDLNQIQADIADAAKDVRDKWRVQILTRLLKRGDDSGTNKGLGSTGLSPGFATAAASTGVDYTPPAMGGTAFDSDHEHYNAAAGGAFTLAILQAAHADLREHGWEPPYKLITGLSDKAAIEALDGFVERARMGVRYGAMQDLAIGDPTADGNGNYFIGVIEDFDVHIVRGMPQYYGFAWKPMGSNQARNPLKIRVQKGDPLRPNVQVFPDPRMGAGPAYPLQWMMFFSEFGVGVAERTNGVAIYNNNATWADGTPT